MTEIITMTTFISVATYTLTSGQQLTVEYRATFGEILIGGAILILVASMGLDFIYKTGLQVYRMVRQ